MSLISSRLSAVKPSPTLAVSTKAKELKDQGVDIISLGAGEPDFDTPDNIKQAAIDGIKAGHTKYTPAGGTPELKEAICSKLRRENSLEYDKSEIIVGTGAKQVIYNLFMATINEGDEVLIPVPYWVSYPDMVLLAGGKPKFLKSTMETGFKIDPAELDKSITKKTKWLILNSPSNPSGGCYRADEMKAIAEVVRKHKHLHVMCDDIYEHIIYDGFEFTSLPSVAPDLKERSFVINGVSKAYAMTGWRIGYGAGSSEIIKALNLIQSQSTSNPSSISQIAAIEALNGPQGYIQTNANNFAKKRDLVIKNIKSIEGLDCNTPEGAFYLFPKCSGLFGKTTKEGKVLGSSNEVATYLLEEANVAVIPGIAFGMDEHFRLSYATSVEVLEEACNRIAKAVKNLA